MWSQHSQYLYMTLCINKDDVDYGLKIKESDGLTNNAKYRESEHVISSNIESKSEEKLEKNILPSNR